VRVIYRRVAFHIDRRKQVSSSEDWTRQPQLSCSAWDPTASVEGYSRAGRLAKQRRSPDRGWTTPWRLLQVLVVEPWARCDKLQRKRTDDLHNTHRFNAPVAHTQRVDWEQVRPSMVCTRTLPAYISLTMTYVVCSAASSAHTKESSSCAPCGNPLKIMSFALSVSWFIVWRKRWKSWFGRKRMIAGR